MRQCSILWYCTVLFIIFVVLYGNCLYFLGTKLVVGVKDMARARVKVHVPKTGRYVRVRVKSPKSFKPKSFRTHDIGRAGHSKRVAGKPLSTERPTIREVMGFL